MKKQLCPAKKVNKVKETKKSKKAKTPTMRIPKEVTAYTKDGRYIAGQRIHHSQFGFGYVTFVRNGKVLVLMDFDRSEKKERQFICAETSHDQRIKANKNFRKMRPISKHRHVRLVMEIMDKEKVLQMAPEKARKNLKPLPKKQKSLPVVAEIEAIPMAS